MTYAHSKKELARLVQSARSIANQDVEVFYFEIIRGHVKELFKNCSYFIKKKYFFLTGGTVTNSYS